MKRKIILLLLFFVSCAQFLNEQPPGEGNNNMPQIFPPSPDAASLGKYGDIPIGKHTGTANISVPVYSINFDGLTIPISLSYHSGGIRVEELASWVGQGWSLNAGGAITITVVGLPDHQSGSGYLNNAYNDVEDIQLMSVEDQREIGIDARNGVIDLEPDLYSYNFVGQSGRFFIDKVTSKVHTIPKSNLKFNYPSWEIIDAQGFKYIFGAGETNFVETNMTGGNNTHSYTSTLVLTKIISPAGNEINFTYQDYTNIYFTRGGQSKNIQTAQGGTGCTTDFSLKNNFSLNEIQGKRIHEITWSEGKVVFNKGANNRTDIVNDYRLDSITVFNAQNVLIKKQKLFYSFKTCTGGAASFGSTFTDLVAANRLFLDSLKEEMGNESLSPHAFTYDNTQLPYYLSMAQDHWGYYNGQSNFNLLPVIAYENVLTGNTHSYGDANRNVNATNLKAGSLNKITYPTGGETEFKYEPNEALIPACTYMNMFNPNVIDNAGPHVIAFANQYNTLDTLIVPSSLCNENRRRFEYEVYLPNVSNCPGSAKDCTGNLQIHLFGPSSQSFDLLVNPAVNHYVRGYLLLDTGTSYVLELDGPGGTIAGVTVTVKGMANPIFFTDGNTKYINTKVGGLRVQSIINKSIAQSPDTTLYYYYDRANVLDTAITGQKSSGRVNGIPRYFYESSRNCGTGGSGPNYANFITLFSSSQVSVSNDGVIYKMAEEIDKGKDDKLRSVSTFTTNDDYTDVVYNTYPFIKYIGFDYLKGLLLKEYKLKYNRNSQSYNVLSETANTYTISDLFSKQIKGLRWACQYFGYTGGAEYPICTEVFRLYKFYSKWFYLSSTTEKLYESSDTTKYITTKSSYFYSDTNHLQITRMHVIDSKGDTLQTDYKYPHNFTGTEPYTTMVNTRHIWSPLIEKIDSNITKDKQLAKLKTNYQFWWGNTIIAPSSIERALGNNSFDTKINYNKYDSEGNILSVSRVNDIKQSYIWDYDSSLPIAEFINADTASIAATSFEADGKGGWTYSGSTNNTYSITGSKSYQTSGGNITKTGLPNATYIISYWGRSGSVNVNSAGPTRTGKTIGSWTYYEHEITTTSVTVSGSNYIDELRLYPKGTMVKTITYTPLIGVTSECDATNRIIYYEYDSFNRLKTVKDEDGKILKRYDYKFQQTYQN